RALLSVNLDTTALEQLGKQSCRKLRRILDGQRLGRTRIVYRQAAPKGEQRGAGLAVDVDVASGARGSGNDAVVHLVIRGERRDVDKGAFPGAVAGKHLDEDHVVVDGQGGNGSAVGPYQVVLAPAFAVALEGEVGVVGHHVTVDVLEPFLHQAVGKSLEHLDGMVVALGAQRVGQFASGE